MASCTLLELPATTTRRCLDGLSIGGCKIAGGFDTGLVELLGGDWADAMDCFNIEQSDILPYEVIGAVVKRYVGDKQAVEQIVCETDATQNRLKQLSAVAHSQNSSASKRHLLSEPQQKRSTVGGGTRLQRPIFSQRENPVVDGASRRLPEGSPIPLCLRR